MLSIGTHASASEALAAAELLLERRDLDMARHAFISAACAGADPDSCNAGRWMVEMLSGCFEAAWQQSDAIRVRGGYDPHRFWDGEPVNGKRLIVRCLHGLGDSVQMLRYLPLLRSCCRSVVVEVPPRLLPLASCFEQLEKAITWGKDAPAVQPIWDAQVEVMELPYVLRTQPCDLPVCRNYLSPPQDRVQQTASDMGPADAPRVGIVWSASEWDPTRCLPMDCVHRLLETPNIEFWNLQGGEQHTVGMQSPVVAAIPDAARLGDGLLTLASIITNLDLVITVDTLAAHMAGAMGKPAWVLLQAQADWRWMHGRDDSPWYPTLQLWRQPVQGDWQTITTQVCEALAAWAEER